MSAATKSGCFLTLCLGFVVLCSETVAQQKSISKARSHLRPHRKIVLLEGTLIDEFKLFVDEYLFHSDLNEADCNVLRSASEELAREFERAPDIKVDDDFVYRYYFQIIRKRYLQSESETKLADRDSDRFKEFLKEFRAEEAARDGFTTLEEQYQIFDRVNGKLKKSLTNHEEFISTYHLALLAAFGPRALFSQPSFIEATEIDYERLIKVVEHYKSAAVNEKVTQLKRKRLAEFIDILNMEQQVTLASRLGVAVEYLPEIGELSSAKKIARKFDSKEVWVTNSSFMKEKAEEVQNKLVGELRALKFSLEPGPVLIVELADKIESLVDENGPCLGDLTHLIRKVDEARDLDSVKDNAELNRALRSLSRVLHKYEEIKESPWKWVGLRNSPSLFHAVEIDNPQDRPSESLRNAFSSTLQMDIANQVTVYSGSTRLLFSIDQVRLLSKLNHRWNRLENECESYQEWIEKNNEMIREFGEIAIPIQAVVIFQRRYSSYGPYLFFQRPDVQDDFQISRVQIRKFEEQASHIRDHLVDGCNQIVATELEEMFEKFSDSEQISIERHLGIEWTDFVEYWLKNRGEKLVRYRMRKSESWHIPRKMGSVRVYSVFQD